MIIAVKSRIKIEIAVKISSLASLVIGIIDYDSSFKGEKLLLAETAIGELELSG